MRFQSLDERCPARRIPERRPGFQRGGRADDENSRRANRDVCRRLRRRGLQRIAVMPDRWPSTSGPSTTKFVSAAKSSSKPCRSLIWHEDEPIVWPSSVSLYFVARLARERVTVVLTGEGSDETLAGYTRYAWTLLNSRMDSAIPCGSRPPCLRAMGAHGNQCQPSGCRAFIASWNTPFWCATAGPGLRFTSTISTRLSRQPSKPILSD